jgi:SpoVK/Ycf46/Vps4 family AAA+-type ATPase
MTAARTPAPPSPPDPQRAALVGEFRRAMSDCQELYRRCALETIESYPQAAQPSPEAFLNRMLDLHRGLLAKVLVTLIQADWQLSAAECELAAELIDHVWDTRVTASQLRPAVKQLVQRADKLTWDSLTGPFARLPAFKNRVGDLETVVVRLANLITKIDGQIHPEELRHLQGIQHELERLLRPIPLADVDHGSTVVASKSSLRQLSDDAKQVREQAQINKPKEAVPTLSREEQLAASLADLDKLIGLATIKHDVHELTRFLQMQQQRATLGLPQTKVSLHMVFSGNPGTGKTTVARIVGRLFGAMGIVAKGHLVETDRSGLVAQYSGQTAPKTNKKIDEALDGVLFIDEAYSLVSARGEDPYGAEAVQTLLKRMEDDRHRLVVILAGYPEPIDALLKSNPGLSSRFNRSLHFEDYSTVELARILHSMCERDHYILPAATRARVLRGFHWLVEHRDEHFGNGRLVRNTFERAIRRLATRIAGIAPLTRELLTVLEPADIHFDGVPAEFWQIFAADAPRFRIGCPQCRHNHLFQAKYLCQSIKCKRCAHQFPLDWGEPVPAEMGEE